MNRPTTSAAGGNAAVEMANSILRPFTYSFSMVGAILGPLWRAFWKAYIFVLYLPLQALLKFTPIGFLINKFTHSQDPLAKLDEMAKAIVEKQRGRTGDAGISAQEDLLVQGKRREYAERVAPPEKFPTLYTDVPSDIQRPIVQDGRLVNGDAPATGLAGLTLTREFVAEAWRGSVRVATKAAYLVVVGGLIVTAVIAGGRAALSSVAMPPAALSRSAESAMGPTQMAMQYRDLWTPADRQALQAELAAASNSASSALANEAKVKSWAEAILLFLLVAAALPVLAVGVGYYVWIGRVRYLVHHAVDASVAGLRHSWREALQRWRWRLADREMEHEAHNSQVKFVTEIDRSPTIELGEALGVMEYRGHLLAPQQGQSIRMSVSDALQHVAIFGSSGEGKSRNFYVPVVRQLLELRKQGYPIAIYATDDKGAIGKDVLDLAESLGLPQDDVLVIGTGPNDYRVDLLDGLDPITFADVLTSVAKQAAADLGGDGFWPDMASDLVMNVGVVLQAAEYTDKGAAWVRRHGMRMCSVVNILRVACDDEEIMAALQIVYDAMQDKEGQYASIAHLDKSSLRAATEYLTTQWLPMVEATKHGIMANVRKSLRAFAMKEELAAGFATGAGDRLIPIGELLSNKIKIVNISQIEHGLAGRMVAVMLKAVFFRQAREAEQRDPRAAAARLKWWFNPNPQDPTRDSKSLQFFLADEYQALVTASNDGISDSTFFNVARSAGVAGVILSQSTSAYRQAIGDKATDNMLSNFRTKLYLRTEDHATIDDARKLAGKALRFHSFDWNHLESAAAVRREIGVSADNLPRVEWNPEFDNMPVLLQPGMYEPMEFAEYNQAYELDERFIPSSSNTSLASMLTGGSDAVQLQARQAAAWRHEDRTSGALQHGMQEADCCTEQDLMQMGRARALAFVQRGGSTRVDFIRLLDR